MQPERDYETRQGFASACKDRRLSAEYAEDVFGRLSDRSSFGMALESIAKLPVDQVSLFAENIQFLTYLPRGNDQDASVGLGTTAISVRELLENSRKIASHAKNLRQLVLDFEVPASEVAATVTDFALPPQTIDELRGSLSSLESIVRIGHAWAVALDQLKDQKRSVYSTPPLVEQFVRRLARVWLRGGGEVVSSRDSEFAVFLENSFAAVGAGRESTFRLEAALFERSRNDGVEDIFSTIATSRKLRRRRAFDQHSRSGR